MSNLKWEHSYHSKNSMKCDAKLEIMRISLTGEGDAGP